MINLKFFEYKTRRNNIIQATYWNNNLYLQHGRYFESKLGSLHRNIWEHYNGTIPQDYDVYFRDKNFYNFDITNLGCKSRSEHISEALTGTTIIQSPFSTQRMVKTIIEKGLRKGDKNGMYNKHHSPEAKEKIKQARIKYWQDKKQV